MTSNRSGLSQQSGLSDLREPQVGRRVAASGSYWVEIQDGSEKGRRVDIAGEPLVIGRDNSTDIYLRDVEVSRNHARLEVTPAGLRVTDLGSSNGTYVDERSISEELLSVGSVLRIGQTRMVVGQTPVGRQVFTTPLANIDLLDDDQANHVVHSMKAKSTLPKSLELAGDLSHREVRNFQSIYEFLMALTGATELNELLDGVLKLVVEKTQADRGCILLLDEQSGSITNSTVRHGLPVAGPEKIQVSRTLLELVRERHEGLLTNDAKSDSRLENAASIQRADVREAICVPMMSQQHLKGVIYLDTNSEVRSTFDSGSNRFNEDHLHLVMVIGHYAGMAIENAQYQQALLQAERMATIGKVTATLAHHVRNIVHGIGGGAWLIEDGIKSDLMENVNDGWQIVCKYQDRINQLILNLLTVSKPSEPDLKVGNANNIVSEVVKVIGRHATDLGVQLNFEATPQLPPVRFGQEEMEHALLNIVTNAIDACRKRTNPRVDIRTVLDRANHFVRISVVDNGDGIPPERHVEIFELFSSNKGNRGSGIGLPVSLQIVKAHGGTIELVSHVGSGSQFDLLLPIEPANSGDTIHGQ